MKELEVRCCCNPGKLLGTLKVPDHVEKGDQIQSMTKAGKVLTLDVAEWMRVRDLRLGGLELAIDVSNAIAIKSNDYPMEDLKEIPGFVPVPEA